MTKPTKPTTKNHIAIGQKTDLRQCASVSIMKKPISIGSVINLEKNRPYRTTHTPTTRQPSTRCLRAMIPPTRFKTIGRGWLLVSKTVQSHSSSWVQIGPWGVRIEVVGPMRTGWCIRPLGQVPRPNRPGALAHTFVI